MQCLCLTKFGSRSRSEFKIKHYLYDLPSSISLTTIKNLTLFPMLHIGYSSPSVIALVYDFTSLYIFLFHPVTYRGRHDCFRFRKHPSSCIYVCSIAMCDYIISLCSHTHIDVRYFTMCMLSLIRYTVITCVL